MFAACIEGNLEVVKSILSSHPESINFSNEVGNLFFFFFFFFHYSSTSHFGSCICFSQSQWTLLHYACSKGHKEVVLVLLAHKANVEAQNVVSDFWFWEQ